MAVLWPGTGRGFLPSRVKVWISLSLLRTVIVPPALTGPGIMTAKSLIVTASVAAPLTAGGVVVVGALDLAGLVAVVVVVVVVVGMLDFAGLVVGDGCGWPVGLATAGAVVGGMLEPLGIGVGDPVGAPVVAVPVVAWTAELAAGVDGVLEQAADRLTSTSAGRSRRLW